MKNLITITTAALIILVSSCTKTFLDLKPLDQATEAVYYKNPDQFKAAANDFYNKMIGFRPVDKSSIYNWMDLGSDLLSPGYGWPSTLNAGDIYWNNPYAYIRANNILIGKGAQYAGDYAGIKQYIAAAYFFRAWHHFFLLKRFGGVPIDTIVTDVNSSLLKAPRNSRYEVTRQILSDLDVAIDGLPLESTIATTDKGQVSKQAAMAFKARVLLYEGTYEKYVGKATDGDGVSTGAGSAAYDAGNVTKYLTEAVSLCQQVMSYTDYSLFNGVDSLSYRYLFILDDAASNPKGLTKTANREFILSSRYDYTLLQGNVNITHSGSGAITRKLMDMFLCKDGLPYSVSPLAKGYASMTDEFDNRESRMTCITGKPKQKYWGFSSAYGANYSLANYLTVFNWPAYINVLYPDLSNGGSGYGSRKWSSESANRNDNQESYDYPQIRLAEVYLTYAEAKCELNNGTISDADLNISINKIRARAGAAPLTNALIAPYASLTMLGEIRRERTLELLGENTRFTDLFRWGTAEQELNQVPMGMVVQYNGQPAEIATFTNPYTKNSAYKASTYPFGIDPTTGAVILSGPPKVPMTKNNYLTSIPQDQITLNPNLLQNPGY